MRLDGRHHGYGKCLSCGNVTGRPSVTRCYPCSRLAISADRRSRFFLRTIDVGDCREWAGARNHNGYGRVQIGRRRLLAHRAAWEIAQGPIPAGLHVLHHCDNPPCVKPAHLWLGTDADNVHDMDAKGRRVVKTTRGEQHPAALLTEAAVRVIRDRLREGRSHVSLGVEYGVDRSTITRLARGQTWTHVA